MKATMKYVLIVLAMLSVCNAVAAGTDKAMNDSEIPSVAPKDSVMASPQDVQHVLNWAGLVFCGVKPEGGSPAIGTEVLLPESAVPFSFVYGGKPSSEFLDNWKRTVETKNDQDVVRYRTQWADPKTGLVVTADVKVFKNYPAVDWVLFFENAGAQDTPIIDNIQALDLRIGNGPVVLHQLEGDACGDRSFKPIDRALEAGKSIRMAPSGGRPSNSSAFPFFNLQCGDSGIITAIGWSGQWAATFDRAETGSTRVAAGMELTHLLLHPGEKIRSPRIVVMPWKGDRTAAHNRWRRLLLFQYVPKNNGKPARIPIVMQCFDRYSGSRADWATEGGQIAAAKAAYAMGMDTLWLDAAWFPGGFPNGVGNWYAKPKEFPNGLKPVSDWCHGKGMKFVLWFEPERVAKGTQIATEHPDFVFGGKDGGLYKLNAPVARRFLTDLLSTRITEYGIDIYRNDFNIDPLGFWRGNDAPDRQGMTEIRYVEGHYAMWDELLAKHPGLMIDNCASGGRRIDIETCMRSVPLWRSDTSCSPGHPEWNQLQTAGLSQYIPFHTACAWIPEPYDFRSAATIGAIAQFDYLAQGFPMDVAKASIAEAKENQKYWYGDFYLLSNVSIAPDQFMAYQFHRADLEEGLVLAFRHPECNYLGPIVGLHGLNPEIAYVVEYIDDARHKTVKTVTGKDLFEGTDLRIPSKGGSLVIRYRRE
jgi:alpha-galactosidase